MPPKKCFTRVIVYHTRAKKSIVKNFTCYNDPGDDMDYYIYIGIIRDLREDSDLTQRQVAEYLGTSQTMYARYERGTNELPIRHLLKLCELYKVSADRILGLDK